MPELCRFFNIVIKMILTTLTIMYTMLSMKLQSGLMVNCWRKFAGKAIQTCVVGVDEDELYAA